jgi:hypothetical protein
MNVKGNQRNADCLLFFCDYRETHSVKYAV